MLRKKEKSKVIDLNKQEISTVIGEGYHITGEIKGSSVIRIDGRVSGNVVVEGGIVLGVNGVIEGDLISRSAIIHGTVSGNVVCKQVEIKNTGVVTGDIETDTIEMELGSHFTGKLRMKTAEAVDATTEFKEKEVV
ncbi:MAG TPA: polymer-forming cytoskeletal protein [Ginsengibacter sp.]|nr:polymer-forming cytoskeletal protein [Ginsengibacter sp.]HRP18280.1 polymer-forming cytoskeletal protein [Ginsengibacter sp.]HRP45164.1 polymer-forming cytoskeletal protein [Ginsengibacter sp.]